MESDKRYFFEGLFIIGFAIAAAVFAMWIVNTGHRDDVFYRVRFPESVSGMAVGDPVKFHGVDVGTVKAMDLDPSDPRRVQVDLQLRKKAPVKTDTRATLKLKGITGVVYVELTGGAPDAQSLAAAIPPGQMPEIPYQKSSVATLVETLPRVIEKFSALEDKATKVVNDVGGVTSQIKEDPSVLLKGPKKEKTETTASATSAGPKGPRGTP
jgi:phospholipid/cholesterol/gamma-HCH transport system substrate-binding protein